MKKALFIAFILSSFFTSKGQENPKSKNTTFSSINELHTTSSDTTYIINFWATWCGPCIKELPDFQQAMAETADQKVKFVYISLDAPTSEERVNKFIEDKKLKGTFYLLKEPDPNTWVDLINPDWQGNIPATLIINKAKNYNWFHAGILNKDSLIDKITKSN